jgi:RimJ/RimL family protein N-acetyltransferase
MKLHNFIIMFLFCSLRLGWIHTVASNIHFEFRKITDNDTPLMLEWFNEPLIQKWWPTPDEGQAIADFIQEIRSKNTFGYIVLLNKKPLGFIQYYHYDPTSIRTGQLVPDLPKKTIGIDQFIGDPKSVGKGYGTQMLKEFIVYLRTIEPTITTIILDPKPDNIAAIRCYEKVGFKRLGVHDTPWGPTLLMRYDIE